MLANDFLPAALNMNKSRRLIFGLSLPMAAALVAASIGAPFSRALDLISDSEQITAISAKVHNGYIRAKLPDGTFRTETYVIGRGGFLGSGAAGVQMVNSMRDNTIDSVTVDAIARTLAAPLADQHYAPAQVPDAADLMIMVYWGLAIGGGNTNFGQDKDKVDAKNAALMGFDSEGVFGQGFGDTSNVMSIILRQVHSDVIDAIEVNRYFVVLLAFDLQSALKQKKIRLLWDTRFSLSQRRHDFAGNLPAMTLLASRYFGQDSQGLVRTPIPEGHIEIGPVKSLGEVPEKPGAGTGQPPSKP
jgi:hypothetical protein